LVLRAAYLLKEKIGVSSGARIVLDKCLPIASGIGGGSADAAATLIGLNQIWGSPLSRAQLATLSVHLGADVPVCVRGVAAHMTGTGEATSPIPALPPIAMVLVNPMLACPTGPVFARYDARGGIAPLTKADVPPFNSQDELLDYLRATPNDLTQAACDLVPAIGDTLQAIATSPEVLLTRMSGSGATCFGLYANLQAAKQAAASIKKALANPSIWVEADEISSQ
jgi:4-diphosphocytidyl-2-C-methyl-D-erythritol kinase